MRGIKSSIWLFAILGLIIGIGEYLVGLFVYLLIWVVIFYDGHMEKAGIGYYRRKVTIVTNKMIEEKSIRDYFLVHTRRYNIMSVHVHKDTHEAHMVYMVEATRDNLNKLMRNLYKEEWLKSCHVE